MSRAFSEHDLVDDRVAPVDRLRAMADHRHGRRPAPSAGAGGQPNRSLLDQDIVAGSAIENVGSRPTDQDVIAVSAVLRELDCARRQTRGFHHVVPGQGVTVRRSFAASAPVMFTWTDRPVAVTPLTSPLATTMTGWASNSVKLFSEGNQLLKRSLRAGWRSPQPMMFPRRRPCSRPAEHRSSRIWRRHPST